MAKAEYNLRSPGERQTAVGPSNACFLLVLSCVVRLSLDPSHNSRETSTARGQRTQGPYPTVQRTATRGELQHANDSGRLRLVHPSVRVADPLLSVSGTEGGPRRCRNNLVPRRPPQDNLFEWHFTILGPADTAFEGGRYHGRIVLPSDYPMKPPSILMLTVSGRGVGGALDCCHASDL